MGNAIEILNDVTRKLIDSRKGYQNVIEACDDNFVLHSQFKLRMNNRKSLIRDFQNKVTALGGEPEHSGSIRGAAQLGFAEFASLFQDDEKVALRAVDDGEEDLADYIESKLEEDDLTLEVRNLLRKALESAKSGERFADSLDD